MHHTTERQQETQAILEALLSHCLLVLKQRHTKTAPLVLTQTAHQIHPLLQTLVLTMAYLTSLLENWRSYTISDVGRSIAISPRQMQICGIYSTSIATNFLIFFVLIYRSAQNASMLLLTQSNTTLYSIMMPTTIRHLLKSSLQLLFTGLDITGMLLVQ